jgi:hypothetical protein
MLTRDYLEDPKEILYAITDDADRFAAGLPVEDDQALLLCVIE